MAVTSEAAIKRFRGLSTDEKPGLSSPAGEQIQKFPVNSVFTERDTGERYIWDGVLWFRQEQTIETRISELTDVMFDILAEMKVVRQATATLANNACETDIPTGVE